MARLSDNKPVIDEQIPMHLDGDMQKFVQSFVAWLRDNGMNLIWSSAYTWKAGYKGETICSVQMPLHGFKNTWLVSPHLFRMDAYKAVIETETTIQKEIGPDILKAGYAQLYFPAFAYGHYGYEYYFSAYALYPEVFDRYFTLQGDYWYLRNKAVVKAYKQADLPLYHRLDHDMADGRGVLVDVKTLERAWVPAFIKALSPVAEADFTLLWHCDGNLMKLIPYLLEAGVNGFQGFQYEFEMDYPYICNLKAKDGKSMVIEAGVSVTRELPMGKPDDVKKQLDWLVEYGPKTGLFLGMSSSCVPGTPYENIRTAIEGMQYYKTHGRK